MPVAKPLPSQDFLTTSLSYDPSTGILLWRHRVDASPQWNGKYAGKVAGSVSKSNGHCVINLSGKLYLVHRIVWKMVHGVDPPLDLDHHDGNATNNQLENLRPATKHQNLRNSKLHRGKTLPKGVSWHTESQRYRASIYVTGRHRHLGLFDDPAEAHEAYRLAAVREFGTFARFS